MVLQTVIIYNQKYCSMQNNCMMQGLEKKDGRTELIR